MVTYENNKCNLTYMIFLNNPNIIVYRIWATRNGTIQYPYNYFQIKKKTAREGGEDHRVPYCRYLTGDILYFLLNIRVR